MTPANGPPPHRVGPGRAPHHHQAQPELVPSLDALAADPALVDTLPPKVAVDLYRQIAPLEGALRARVLTADSRTDDVAVDLIDVRTAARKLGLAPSTLYQKSKRPPLFDLTVREDLDGVRRLRFRARDLDEFIRRRGRIAR